MTGNASGGNTVVVGGSAGANKIFNAALFNEAIRRNTLTNLLTGDAPKALNQSKMDSKRQTEPGAPIIRITDLSKEMGQEVTMDLFHQLQGMATMGDRELDGRVESLSSSQFSLRIDQGRKAVSSGGRMTQQRTKHDLVRVAKGMIGPWLGRREDQLTLVHLAGARGDDDAVDWLIPSQGHDEFEEQIVNPILPPTSNRHAFGGDAQNFGDIDSADIFSLAEVDKLRLLMDESALPIQPIRYDKDPMAEDNPFYVLLVSPRQWYDFWTSTSGKEWQSLLAAASVRAKDFKHPLFTGDCVMWNNILIKKATRPISFNAGSTVNISNKNKSATVTQDTAGVRIHRALLLGAQAMATAYGRSGEKEKGGLYFSMTTEEKDHGNKKEHSIAWMNGKKKIRFKGSDGYVTDHGVFALDTAVSTTI